jgi:hypothetical protein
MPLEPELDEDPAKLEEATKESFEKVRKLVREYNRTLPETEEPPLFRPSD